MNKKQISRFLLIAYLLQILEPTTARALLTNVNPGSAVVNCDTFCANFNVSVPSYYTNNTWTPTTDGLCSVLGYSTSNDPNLLNVIANNNISTSNLSATDTTNATFLCKYHNSQVEQYCGQYNAIKAKNAYETQEAINIALTATALVACTTACFSGVALAAALNTMCTVAGGAASIAELVSINTLNNTPTAQAIDNFVGSAALVGTVAAGAKAGSSASWQGMKNFLNPKYDPAADPTSPLGKANADVAVAEKNLETDKNKLNLAKTENNQAAKDLAQKDFNNAETALSDKKSALKNLEEDSGFAKKNASKNKGACFAAAMLAAELGVRSAMLNDASQSASGACSQVQGLATVGGDFTNYPGGPVAAPTSSSPANPGALTPVSYGAQSALDSYIQCAYPPGGGTPSQATLGTCAQTYLPASLAGNTSQATEGNILSNPALPSLLAATPNLDGLVGQIASNGPGAALSGMGGGASIPAGAMNSLGAIANAAKKDAAVLAPALGISAPAAIYASGGSNKHSAGDSANPFSSLFGANKSAGSPAAAASSGTNQFGTQNTDIWHSNTNLNIFQIISEKIKRYPF